MARTRRWQREGQGSLELGGRDEGRKDWKTTLKGQVWEIGLKVGPFAEKGKTREEQTFWGEISILIGCGKFGVSVKDIQVEPLAGLLGRPV